MKKTRMQFAILVAMILLLLPVSVTGQSASNVTVVPTINVTTSISPVTTQAPSGNTTTIPVNVTTTIVPVTTTPVPVTTAEPLPSFTVTTATPVPEDTGVSVGSIAVASSPLGAGILIDGVYYGVTPGNITGIPAGNHIVRLALSGYYDYEGTMYVVPGQVTSVFGTLPPLGYSGSTSTVPATPVPTTTTAPADTAQPTPTPTSSAGALENPTIIAAIIGVITACIGAGATIFTHISKTKKE
jgi:hypothetical protein